MAETETTALVFSFSLHLLLVSQGNVLYVWEEEVALVLGLAWVKTLGLILPVSCYACAWQFAAHD